MVRAVVFDFDYTLADSSAGVAECVNFALVKMGLPPVSSERARETIGLSLPETFFALTGTADESLALRFATYFVQRADEVMEALTHLYGAVPHVTQVLRRRGLALGIVSTKFRYRIDNILRRYGLGGQFQVIVGGEDVASHKPDPAGLVLALAHLGVGPDEALYVGDHVVDAAAARRAGVPFVGVLSGPCRQEDFRGYPVLAFVAGIGDLLTLDLGSSDRNVCKDDLPPIDDAAGGHANGKASKRF